MSCINLLWNVCMFYQLRPYCYFYIQGPTSNGYTCYCEPFIHRFEQCLDHNKKEVVKHLQNTHGRLANRISSLERKTKDQISHLSNSMKENIAQVHIRI